MKKYLALILALVMSLSLVACGGGETAEEEGGDATVIVMTYLNAPDTLDMTGAHEIYNNALLGNDTIATVKLSKTLTKIGDNAFADCTALATIVFDGTKAEWEAIEKGEDWNLNMVSYTIDCTDEDIVVAPEVTPEA